MNNNFQPYKQSSLKTDLFFLVSSLVNNNILLIASFLAFLSFGDFGRGAFLVGISEYIESGTEGGGREVSLGLMISFLDFIHLTDQQMAIKVRSGASLNTLSTNCIGKTPRDCLSRAARYDIASINAAARQEIHQNILKINQSIVQ